MNPRSNAFLSSNDSEDLARPFADIIAEAITLAAASPEIIDNSLYISMLSVISC